MKNKNTKVLLIGIIGTLIGLIGVSYAWFSLFMSGRGPEYIVSSGNLKLIYTDTLRVDAEGIAPGWSLTKTFTVENTSTKEQYYKIIWKDLINTFVNTEDLTIEVTSTNNGGSLDKTPIPSSSEAKSENIIENITIAGKTIQTYTVKLEYAKKETDQTEDMGKIFSGTIEIEGLASIGDLSVLAYTCKSCTNTPASFPTQNDGYRAVSVSCTNGATGEWDAVKWGLTATNITGPTSCTVDFAEGNVFFSQILQDNPNISERETFNAAFTTSNNGNTIYKAIGQEDKEIYYFAGNVTNNYVKFGTDTGGNDLYWRIVRINEDKSVRLLYAGTSATDTAAFINTGLAYNTSANNPAYVGYKYTLSEQYGLGTNSNIKNIIDTWYTNTLESEYDKYISKTAIYCNERTIGSGTWTAGSSQFFYAGYIRLRTNKAPIFNCTNASDRFTASATVGNNALTKPIGLLTADEVAYAGGLYDTDNTSYYIYQNASTGANYWWTMTPHRWNGSYAYMFNVGGTAVPGGLSDYGGVSGTYGVRPVVSLKSCTLYAGGDGTSENPYTVNIGDECATKEN